MTTDIYFNRRSLADACGFLAVEDGEVVIHKLGKAGGLPEHDVAVGSRLGWTRERVALFGEYYRNGKTPEPQDLPWWTVPDGPRVLLSRDAVSALLGIVKITLMKRVEAGRFTEPAVAITRDGELIRGTSYGWTREQVIEYGKQWGYLNAQGEIADIRQGGSPRKVFTTTAAVA